MESTGSTCRHLIMHWIICFFPRKVTVMSHSTAACYAKSRLSGTSVVFIFTHALASLLHRISETTIKKKNLILIPCCFWKLRCANPICTFTIRINQQKLSIQNTEKWKHMTVSFNHAKSLFLERFSKNHKIKFVQVICR